MVFLLTTNVTELYSEVIHCRFVYAFGGGVHEGVVATSQPNPLRRKRGRHSPFDRAKPRTKE